MKYTPSARIAALGSIAALLVSSCAANEAPSTSASQTAGQSLPTQSALSGELVGAGASSQGAAQEAWIANFQTQNPNVVINYDPSGSGTGRETFQNGASAFAGSDRAFKSSEIADGTFAACVPDSDLVEFPAYISPIAIAFNLPGIDSLNLDADTLGKIFAGSIHVWNDPTIAALNPDVELPSTPIAPVHRSDKSGTTLNFTDYLAAAAPDAWTAGAIEEWPGELGGEGAQGTSGVISAITGGVGTIGYADASRASDLATVKVKVGDDYVAYTPQAAAAVVDASPIEDGRASTDLAITLDRSTTEAGVYPIVLVSYLIGCSAYENAADAELVRSYFSYVVSDEGQAVAAEAAGSAPLSGKLRSQIADIVAAIR